MPNIGIFPKLFINASIFLFFTLLLMFPKGYNYGSTALLVLSVLFLCYLLYKRVSFLTIVKQDKAIFMVTAFYFLVSLFFIFFHGEKINLIDNPLRAFLFLYAAQGTARGRHRGSGFGKTDLWHRAACHIDMVVNIPKNLTSSELSNGYKIRRSAVPVIPVRIPESPPYR